MTTQPNSGARRRAPLSKERVLRAAIELADKEGIESLTMRRLGQQLGVEAMSLYKHVANKDDILDGITELIVSEIDLPPTDVEWKAAMRRRALSTREVLTRHPWATRVMESRTNPGPATLRYFDSVIASLRTGGFPVALAAHAFSVLDSYIFGFVVQQTSLPFDSSEELTDVTTDILEQMSTDQFPHLTEMAVEHILQPGYDHADEFEFGLDLIIDALERARDG
jgi:AcrR family transcriptional regulator